MDNDERTEIIDDYDVESGNNGGNILKPLLAILGLMAAGIGGFVLFFKKRKKAKYIELSTNNQNNQDDKYQDDEEE